MAQGKEVATPEFGAASFVTDTAKSTGRAASVVRQASLRARELGDDIQRIAGTSLDKGVERGARRMLSWQIQFIGVGQ